MALGICAGAVLFSAVLTVAPRSMTYFQAQERITSVSETRKPAAYGITYGARREVGYLLTKRKSYLMFTGPALRIQTDPQALCSATTRQAIQ